MSADPCRGAEHLMQPYLDRALTEVEVARIDEHLQTCGYCNERYVFERRLREVVKDCCCGDPVPSGFVDRLRLRCCGQDDAA
ncbi:MAG TPA: zf-HC2 domain-containing protein [Gaiellales bacterium]|jgi:mycothiol system anti-sigma-R factor|nr:zf-HC2 domain-containing protein [Gaiellales bacterium]